VQRHHPRLQYFQVERLDQVVIRAFGKPFEDIFPGIPGGQHQHRGIYALTPEFPAYGQTIHARQHDIQYDQVVAVCQSEFQPELAIGGMVQLIALQFEVVEYDSSDV